ncbi:Xanthan lyase precursor [Planctomycetes bacterium Pan216]|uniref:Xanthan lyase n=2 Tax=Kolteria novifilia TaxID=2527975 RepID=A0A518B045_9BACT|nr:Xanthan lyase precursor [Planctomycetes bacterium Pan216]
MGKRNRMIKTFRAVCSLRAVSAATLFLASITSLPAAESKPHDVVIYGGTSAAIAAAVQVARMGKSVIIVSPDKHLGGLSSGGLGWTDSGRKEAIGGISREFYQRVKKHYDKPEAWIQQKPEKYSRYRPKDDAMWVFEPRVAEQVFEDLVKEHGIEVVREEFLDRESGVKKDGSRIEAITTLSGNTYPGKIFMDTTYEGDLLAAAGVGFHVGREPNSKYGETLNGVQARRARSHQFDAPVDPYIVPGDPSSGLLPNIHPGPPGKEGEGDDRVQAYNFRMCLTTAPDNLVPFPKPDNYDPMNYELLRRYLDTGWKGVFNKFDPAPNYKTDTNNHGAFSTDYIGKNYDYPEASYDRRREIIKEHEDYQKGWLYFLANDPRVPKDISEKMNKWGLAKDEFVDNGNWPHQIYVREARRMVSDFVMSEPYLRALKPTPESVGMGSYNMDSHNTQRYVDEKGHARNEGDIQVSPGGPYPISYRAIVPKRDECTNLLVPVCLSSSHIAYGSIRMEPVFMVLGQSAATAAAQALDRGVPVQDVDYDKLKERLLADGQVLEMSRTPRPPSAPPVLSQDLKGISLDDQKAVLTGNWGQGRTIHPYVDHGYLHDGNEDKGKKTASFETNLKPGNYDVRIAYSAHSNRATNVPVTIHHADGVEKVTLNEKTSPKVKKLFSSLGKYRFSGDAPAKVVISNEGTDGYVIVDAVQFLPVK